MKNNREFLKCAICGNVVGMVDDKGPKLSCCGQEMDLLTCNTVEASAEKHLPVATYKDGALHVQIGSQEHPHISAHHICWIAAAQGQLTQRIALDNEEVPAASFYLEADKPISIYAYCNLHGLWASEWSCA